MRYLKWVSVLTILAMLFAMLPATVAEDELVIDADEMADEELEVEIEEEAIEEIDAYDDQTLSLEGVNLEMEGLEDNLLISETEEQDEVAEVSNAGGEFEIDEEGTLIRYGGFATNVVIPYGVKSIGESAFGGYAGMVSVSIPDSVTYIGWYAFQGCTGLKSVTIPEGVREISLETFEGCTGLISVVLPNTLETIGWRAFYGCTSLKSITIPKSVTGIDSDVFVGCTSLTNIQLPTSMTELPSGMFSYCNSLDNLDFLSGITKIGDSALSGCDGLKNITIPSSVTSIGSNAFGFCENLESVTIHSGVTFIDRTAFDGSDNVVIRGTKGSTAESYANGVGIPFNAPVVSFDDSCYDYRDEWDDSNKYAVVYINQYRTLGTTQKPDDLARDLAWSSSNPEVATVDQNGQVKGVSQGSAMITANTADGKGKAAQIKVVVPEPTKLWFVYDSWGDEVKDLDIKLRDTRDICIYSEIPYKDETKIDMPVTLTSSDQSIVTAQLTDENKVTLKAINLGKATVTATTPDGGKASIEVEIIRPDAESIKIDQSGPIKLYPGQKYALTTTIVPAEAMPKLTWDTWNTGIATVDQEGMVTAVEPGETEIYVETDNDRDASIDIHVLTPPQKITLSQTKATLAVGDKLTLKAKLTPDNAETGFTWSSSKPSVAKVSQKGKVTALKVGTATITVETDNGKLASATITVKPAPTKVKLNKTKATLSVKEKLTLKATLTPSDACTTLTWTSSKPAVAAVSSQGVVTAKQAGTAVITVRTQNGKKASATITVKPAPTGVKLNKTKATLGVKEKLTLKATVSPSKAYTTLTWKSSKPAVAAVSSQGVVTPKKPGTAVITVRTKNGKAAKFTVTVKAAPKKVTLNKSGTVELKKGKRLKLKATLPKNTASALTWTSSAPKVASVDQKGNVRALKKGTAVITVKTFNGKTAKVTVTVK